jgi:protein-S-isoprenylcysteine O-methyltransferase Ste14
VNVHATVVLGFGAAALSAHAILMRYRARRRRNRMEAGPDRISDPPLLSPTFLFIYALCVAAFLEAVRPLIAAPGSVWPWLVAGALVAAAAEIWMQGASSVLKRHATTESALQPASAIIDEGPFARSRNPIYCGMVLLFAGFAIAAASVWAALCLPVLVATLHRTIVLPEERALTHRFGPVYERYRSRVPRYF